MSLNKSLSLCPFQLQDKQAAAIDAGKKPLK
jgi:hypothetical protein